MQGVPKVLGSREITTVTLSQLEDLEQCTLKGMVRVLNLDGPLPEQLPSRAALIGRFHHRVLEIAATSRTETDVEEAVEREISQLQEVVSGWPHLHMFGSASGWDEVNRSASRAREIATARRDGGEGIERGVEKDLRSRDGSLVGRPDYFSVEDEQAHLREYKSGSIRDMNGRPYHRHVDQVRFYSVLLMDNYNIRRVVANVQSLTGDSYELMIDAADASEFAVRVASVVARVNAEIRSTRPVDSFARPSKDACAYCKAQLLCKAFKSSDEIQALLDNQFLVEGRVVKLESAPSDATKSLIVDDVHRRVDVHLAIPAAVAGEVVVGEKIALQNLRRHGGRFEWGKMSRAFSCG